MSYDECPNCGGEVTRDGAEVLCVGEKDCLWWENVETGLGYDGGDLDE